MIFELLLLGCSGPRPAEPCGSAESRELDWSTAGPGGQTAGEVLDGFGAEHLLHLFWADQLEEGDPAFVPPPEQAAHLRLLLAPAEGGSPRSLSGAEDPEGGDCTDRLLVPVELEVVGTDASLHGRSAPDRSAWLVQDVSGRTWIDGTLQSDELVVPERWLSDPPRPGTSGFQLSLAGPATAGRIALNAVWESELGVGLFTAGRAVWVGVE